MRDCVEFTLNGRAHAIKSPPPTQTLLDWLRYDARLTGTKEGCAEGDCGACTVVAMERDENGAVHARALNACILFLPMADGLSLTTVEGLAEGETLHPVQQAMLDCHGSQCGFCTPGIVMSLYAHHANQGAADLASLNQALAGNLCRCTGYGPILEAARQSVAKSLPPPPVAKPECAGKLAYETSDGALFFAPETLDEICAVAEQYPDAVLLAGATDIGLWVTKQGRDLPVLISVSRAPELRTIKEDEASITFGAGVSFADALPALEALHSVFGPYVRRIGAVQVRESGTLGGNIANGSPIGDMSPALIALGAEIVLRKGKAERRIKLEDFFIAYGKQDRAPGEVLTAIIVPKPAAGAKFGLAKISKRFDQDISAISAGLLVRLEGAVIAEARLAFGGMAGTPKRAPLAEAALVGAAWSEISIAQAAAKLGDDFAPLDDHRASAAYRLGAAQGVLKRFYHANCGAPAPSLEAL